MGLLRMAEDALTAAVQAYVGGMATVNYQDKRGTERVGWVEAATVEEGQLTLVLNPTIGRNRKRPEWQKGGSFTLVVMLVNYTVLDKGCGVLYCSSARGPIFTLFPPEVLHPMQTERTHGALLEIITVPAPA